MQRSLYSPASTRLQASAWRPASSPAFASHHAKLWHVNNRTKKKSYKGLAFVAVLTADGGRRLSPYFCFGRGYFRVPSCASSDLVKLFATVFFAIIRGARKIR